ncbi:MAG: NAD-dependent succinate-semialdehyde dehydrogenase [Rhodospirillaceae bacterium]|jgi:succinate-semialdehyde dehydrogenase / glutarate-semialdehyde dehydrogenase|nr:NAD-dependent succinate-semialdehyde dehydrogenase [Rhodospirillaceae bacterium]
MSLWKTKAFVGGKWCGAEGGKTYEVLNPATGDVIAAVPDMGRVEAKTAIFAAKAAMVDWQKMTAKDRAAILRCWNDLILENKEVLAEIATSECGKPKAEALGEVIYGASYIEWFAEEGKRVYGDVIPSHSEDKRLLTIKQPVGVCAAITPWNFPIAMITRKAGPALAAGCSMVLKPAGATPLSALALAALAEQAGVPPGIFNVITASSGAEVGQEFCENSVVRKLSFTGSTAVGVVLIRQCAGSVKKVSMELGGNAPFIVFDDADLDAAVAGAMASKFRNTGQTCVCANRILVQSGIYDAFAKKLENEVSHLKVGNGSEEGITQGPLINERAVLKVEEHIQDAVAKGAHIICGGNRQQMGGNFFEPTIISEVNSEMKIAREETFGPVAPLFRFDTEDEAVSMANDTEFGLAAYFFSRDISRCWRVAEALECGMVGVNEGIMSTELAPFGGIKESGLGREGSKYGIDEYLELKYMCLGGV